MIRTDLNNVIAMMKPKRHIVSNCMLVISFSVILLTISSCTVMTYYKHDPTEKIVDKPDLQYHEYDPYRVNGVLIMPHFLGITENPEAVDYLMISLKTSSNLTIIRIKEARMNGVLIEMHEEKIIISEKSRIRGDYSKNVMLKRGIERSDFLEGSIKGNPVVVLDVEVTSNGKTERRKLTYIFHKVVKVYPPSV